MKDKSEPINIPTKTPELPKDEVFTGNPKKYQELVQKQRARELFGIKDELPKK